MRITIVGSGYVGLVAGTCFAESGNNVLCLDTDAAKVERLARGELTIYEPGLLDLFQRNTREGRLRFSGDYREAVAHARTYFLCLPTPPLPGGSADIRHVLNAAGTIARGLKEQAPEAASQAPLFVCKSTVPVGTHERVRAAVAECFEGPFSVASNPEFLKEGAAVEDFLKPSRVLLGVTNEAAYRRLRTLYGPFCRTGAPILRMDPASAELAKYAANGFLAVKISFMNEIARLCEATGADVDQVRRGISLDPRIGKAFLFAGTGYGGSCFPKDTRALAATARAKGMRASIVEAAEALNETQKTILLPRILEHLGIGARGPETKSQAPEAKTVALWGLAFKPRTDDIREAPALALIEKLREAGVTVQAYDPEAMENVRRLLGDGIRLAKDPYEALLGAEALVLMTEWNEFRAPDWGRVKAALKRPAVFDGRNIYDPGELRALGFSYWGVGRPPRFGKAE